MPTASGPSASISAFIRAAMSVIASSQRRLDIGVADAAHRVQDATRMLDELVRGAALGAEVLPGVGVLLVGGDLRDPVVLDRDLDAARGQAVPAERVHRPGTHVDIVPDRFPVGPTIGIERIA